jgi:trigger factor
VSDSELTQAVLAQARQYRGQERQFFDYIQKNAAARQQLQAPIFEDKVIDHIFSNAQVEEREVSKDELQQAVEKLDEE